MQEPTNKHVHNLLSKYDLAQKRLIVQRIRQSNQQKLEQAKLDMEQLPVKIQLLVDAKKEVERTRCVSHGTATMLSKVEVVVDKNRGVSDTDKMLFDKKFKNYLNHRQQFQQKAKGRREKIIQARKAQQDPTTIPPQADEQYNQVLSNSDSDYQYQNASDMRLAYDQMTTGKQFRDREIELFNCEKYQNQFRRRQYQYLVGCEEGGKGDVATDLVLQYLFDQPIVMMLYSIHPYQLGDQLAEFQTRIDGRLDYLQFSQFLLTDRQPTFFDYTPQIIQQARKIGRGIKCAPIKAKWIDYQNIYQQLLELYTCMDMHGDGLVNRVFLAKKIRKEMQARRLMDVEVIEIVNIGKFIPLSRLIYQIQFQSREEERQDWTFEEFSMFLSDYKRLLTPEKDKLITKLILTGKYDSSYLYVLPQQALEIIKDVFAKMPKFAQYFVPKQKFLQKLCADPRYKQIQQLYVRAESNRYVKKQSVQQTLVRMYAQGDTYLDIEQVVDFFTNRGRPKMVEYQVHLANLERQLDIMEQEQGVRRLKYGEDVESTSSDDQFQTNIRQKHITRKKQLMLQIKNANVFNNDKKFTVTIPLPFAFDINTKHKKVGIRQLKLKQMLDEKKKIEDESMKQIRAKSVPAHVKQNLYKELLQDQDKERKDRLKRFRLEIMGRVHVSDRLMRPLSTQLHCDFSHEEYKFTARPMPWYCEVNLLDRINQQKQQRKQKILQQLINRNSQYGLPEGLQKMIQRQDLLQQKRAQKRTVSTGSIGDCTFQPKITQGVPDFKQIHSHLNFDVENARNLKERIKLEPFSFENRPLRSRTTHQVKKVKIEDHIRHSKYQKNENKQEFINIPKTQKFDALVSLRRKQQQQRQKKQQQSKRSDVVRKLRQQKFAPIVRKALQRNSNDPSQSRVIIAERIKQFKREQRQRKMDYENQMIKIYTKVFQRPLLVDSGASNARDSRAARESEQVLKKSKAHKKQNEEQFLDAFYPEGQPDANKHKKHKKFNPNEQFQKQQLRMADERRFAAVQAHRPGQYPQDEQDTEYPVYHVNEEEEAYQSQISIARTS